MADTLFTGFDLDAIYNGDKTAVGDAIRLLVQLASQNKGVLPVLTDKIIVPTFTEDGLVIESEDGTRYASIGGGGGTAGQPAAGTTNWETDINLLRRLKLGEVVDIADNFAPGETALGLGFGDNDFVGIGNIMYRLAPTANASVSGIYSSVIGPPLEPNNDSQVVMFWNDSAFAINFDSSIAGVTNRRKILTPFWIGPQGVAILVQEAVDDGWRVLSVHTPQWTPYTPVWVSTGTQPTMGASTVYGRWKEFGGGVLFQANLTLGAGFSFGTGAIGLSLPVALGAANVLFKFMARYADSGTADWPGTAQPQIMNGQSAVRFDTWAAPSAVVTTTSPFTFVAGDRLSVFGWYPTV